MTTAGRRRSTVPRETVSFGQGGRTGHTLIADGYVSGNEFYHRDADADEKGHDHYGPHGESFGDYGKYSGLTTHRPEQDIKLLTYPDIILFNRGVYAMRDKLLALTDFLVKRKDAEGLRLLREVTFDFFVLSLKLRILV